MATAHLSVTWRALQKGRDQTHRVPCIAFCKTVTEYIFRASLLCIELCRVVVCAQPTMNECHSTFSEPYSTAANLYLCARTCNTAP